MITISYPPGRWLELRGAYPYIEQLKTLVDVPGEKPCGDVRWDATRKCWLVDAYLWFHLWWALGDHIAPVAPELFLRMPVDTPPARSLPTTRRRTRKNATNKNAARQAGRTIVKLIKQDNAR